MSEELWPEIYVKAVMSVKPKTSFLCIITHLLTIRIITEDIWAYYLCYSVCKLFFLRFISFLNFSLCKLLSLVIVFESNFP